MNTPETFDTIRQWADNTFGPITDGRTFSRADEEMNELCDAITNEEGPAAIANEAADVIICLARFPGVAEAIQTKMAKNRARKWRLVGDGTGYHIKENAA